MGRLLRDSLDGALHQAFAYDSNGNRTSLTTALGTVSSSYDAQDRLTRSATSGGVVTLYAYGSNGELQTKTDSATGAPTRYQYDALGNLLKVVLPTGDSVEYLIDGQNRRVGRKLNGAVTHRWLYQNQLNPIAELDSAGALVSRFVYGSRGNVPDYLVRGGAVYRLVTDHLGSVRAVVDTATGAVAQWTSYDAWGNVLADSGSGFQPFGFAGGLTDGATGLVRFGARDYDPAAGRWTAKDPVGFLAGGTNLVAYAAQDPIDLLDPSGTEWQFSGGISGLIGGLALIPGPFVGGGVTGGFTSSGQLFVTFTASASYGGGVRVGATRGASPRSSGDLPRWIREASGRCSQTLGLGGAGALPPLVMRMVTMGWAPGYFRGLGRESGCRHRLEYRRPPRLPHRQFSGSCAICGGGSSDAAPRLLVGSVSPNSRSVALSVVANAGRNRYACARPSASRPPFRRHDEWGLLCSQYGHCSAGRSRWLFPRL
ncbi:MAG: RHS repeat-associated core domain-containing protein [Gemmatimonadetes bacterium]|nr:RHS repeat-associated core domain-containing protein [Gemmatimonadota bacterium]